VVAIWEYDDRAAYERIEAAVHADPDSQRAREHRAGLPALMTTTEEIFMSPTVSLTTQRAAAGEASAAP
jgi:hypothetical protein